MKKRRYLIILFILLIVPINKVLAISTSVSVGTKVTTSIQYASEGGVVNGTYHYYPKTMNVGGKTMYAYCLDPGLQLSSSTNYNCTKVNSPALSTILSSNLDYQPMELAVRFYGRASGASHAMNSTSGDWLMAAAITRFIQAKDGLIEMKSYFPGSEDYMNEIYNIIDGLDRNFSPGSIGDDSSEDGNFSMEYVSNAGSSVTFNLYSLSTIPTPTVSGHNAVLNSWNGTSGTLTLNLSGDIDSACVPYKVNISYNACGPGNTPNDNGPGGDVYYCVPSSGDTGMQYLVGSESSAPAVAASSTTTTTPSQSNNNSCNVSTTLSGEIGVCIGNCIPGGSKGYTITKKDKDGNPEENSSEDFKSNCCESSIQVEDTILDSMFGYDEFLKMWHYKMYCNLEKDYYEHNADLSLNDFCDLVCSEKVQVEFPIPTNAISGRYFELAETSYGTKSPYVYGEKGCRILIKFDKWYEAYKKAMKEEINAYNSYQESLLGYYQYKEALEISEYKHDKQKIEVKCEVSAATRTCTRNYTSKEEERPDDSCTGNKKNWSCTETKVVETGAIESKTRGYVQFDYYIRKFNNDNKYIKKNKYYMTKLDAPKGNYPYIGPKSKGTGTVTHDTPYATNDHGSAYSKSVEEMDKLIKEYTEKHADKEPAACPDNFTQDGDITKTAVTCTHEPQTEHEKCGGDCSLEDIEGERDKKAKEAEGMGSAMDGIIDDLKEKLRVLRECQTYLETHQSDDDINERLHWNVQPPIFSYDQVYFDKNGKQKTGSVITEFESTPGCSPLGVTVYTNTGDDEKHMLEKQYSGRYSKEPLVLKVYQKHIAGLPSSELARNANQYKNKIETNPDQADKVFTQDALYTIECKWDEPSSGVYTLVPTGYVETNVSTVNSIKYNSVYHVFTSTMEGEFQTYWKLEGLGHNVGGTEGYFDKKFSEANACDKAGIPLSDYELKDESKNIVSNGQSASCKFGVKHQLILTGKCNGTSSIKKQDCNPRTNNVELFSFRVADPANLLPSETELSDSRSKVAYNWKVDGIGIMQEIKEQAKDNGTYNPENITYAVRLTSSDMVKIRNYNKSREKKGNTKSGGYADFDLTCDCPEDARGISDTDIVCKKCTSKFLTDLAADVINGSDAGHKIWIGKSLSDLRGDKNSVWK